MKVAARDSNLQSKTFAKIRQPICVFAISENKDLKFACQIEELYARFD